MGNTLSKYSNLNDCITKLNYVKIAIMKWFCNSKVEWKFNEKGDGDELIDCYLILNKLLTEIDKKYNLNIQLENSDNIKKIINNFKSKQFTVPCLSLRKIDELIYNIELMIEQSNGKKYSYYCKSYWDDINRYCKGYLWDYASSILRYMSVIENSGVNKQHPDEKDLKWENKDYSSCEHGVDEKSESFYYSRCEKLYDYINVVFNYFPFSRLFELIEDSEIPKNAIFANMTNPDYYSKYHYFSNPGMR